MGIQAREGKLIRRMLAGEFVRPASGLRAEPRPVVLEKNDDGECVFRAARIL